MLIQKCMYNLLTTLLFFFPSPLPLRERKGDGSIILQYLILFNRGENNDTELFLLFLQQFPFYFFKEGEKRERDSIINIIIIKKNTLSMDIITYALIKIWEKPQRNT